MRREGRGREEKRRNGRVKRWKGERVVEFLRREGRGREEKRRNG